MSTEPNITISEKQADAIVRWIDRHDAVESMSDVELSDAVISEVWGQIALCSQGDLLLDEMISRFDKRCGIVRGEDGEVVK